MKMENKDFVDGLQLYPLIKEVYSMLIGINWTLYNPMKDLASWS